MECIAKPSQALPSQATSFPNPYFLTLEPFFVSSLAPFGTWRKEKRILFLCLQSAEVWCSLLPCEAITAERNPKNRMKNQDAKVTEEFVRWLVNQPLKVQENHVDTMSAEQLSDFFRIGCRIFR
jgi:hypothetical protein